MSRQDAFSEERMDAFLSCHAYSDSGAHCDEADGQPDLLAAAFRRIRSALKRMEGYLLCLPYYREGKECPEGIVPD